MWRFAATTALVLSISAPALAAAQLEGTRLSVGVPPAPLGADRAAAMRPSLEDGMRLDLGLSRQIAFGPLATRHSGGFSLVQGGQLAIGAFVEYPIDGFRLGGSVSESGSARRTELSAGYDLGGTAFRVRLGAEWESDGGDAYFSPNPALTGAPAGFEAEGRELDLSVSVSHAITPNLMVSGRAAATRSDEPAAEGNGDVLFGASIGLRF